MSIIDPLSCEFAKFFCYQMFTDRTQANPGNNAKHQQSEILREQFDSFRSQFTSDTLRVTSSQFKDNFRRIINPIQSLRKKYPSKKRELLEIFSSEKWTNIKKLKTKHSLENCTGCSSDTVLPSTLAMIPIKNNKHKQKANENGLVEAAVLKEKTKEIINNLNRDYRKNYRTTFTKQFKKTLGLPDVKNIAKSVKENIEDIWEETCVER